MIVSRCAPISRWIARFERFSTKYNRLISAHLLHADQHSSSPDHIDRASVRTEPDDNRLNARRSSIQPAQVAQYSVGAHMASAVA